MGDARGVGVGKFCKTLVQMIEVEGGKICFILFPPENTGFNLDFNPSLWSGEESSFFYSGLLYVARRNNLRERLTVHSPASTYLFICVEG